MLCYRNNHVLDQEAHIPLHTLKKKCYFYPGTCKMELFARVVNDFVIDFRLEELCFICERVPGFVSDK